MRRAMVCGRGTGRACVDERGDERGMRSKSSSGSAHARFDSSRETQNYSGSRIAPSPGRCGWGCKHRCTRPSSAGGGDAARAAGPAGPPHPLCAPAQTQPGSGRWRTRPAAKRPGGEQAGLVGAQGSGTGQPCRVQAQARGTGRQGPAALPALASRELTMNRPHTRAVLTSGGTATSLSLVPL
jgi:hypothetical protein